jgi:PadR family transcriptional regulator, regulatory protein AphA
MSLEYAVLGFLSYRPMSGYDLKKYFDQSVGHFWSATQSHIYKALDGLQMKGLVDAELIAQQGRPNRKEYRITDSGRAALRNWLTTPLPLEPVREPWLIQVFFAHHLLNEDLARLFDERAELIRSRLAGYSAAQAVINENTARRANPRMRALWQMTLDYGTGYYEFELEWLQRSAERVHELPPLR